MTGGQEPGESLRQFFTAMPVLHCEHSLKPFVPLGQAHFVH